MKFDFTYFIINGFYKTSYADIDNIPIDDTAFDLSDLDSITYPSDVSEYFKKSIDVLTKDIKLTLECTFSLVEFVPRSSTRLLKNKYSVWGGVEPSSREWHNDGIEGGSLFALIYFDSTPEDGSCGGSLKVKTHDIEHTIYPQRGDIIFVSHALITQHKAEPSTIQRRVMNLTFDCHL